MEWILCGIQSPEENQEIILTFKNSVGLHVGEATFKKDAYYYIAETDCDYFEVIFGIPIAWMKMPEPYIMK